MITSGQLRIIWDQFWQERRHVRSNPASLINSGREDAITLFNVAGMQPLVRSLIKDFSVDGKRILIFDRTPFYAKS